MLFIFLEVSLIISEHDNTMYNLYSHRALVGQPLGYGYQVIPGLAYATEQFVLQQSNLQIDINTGFEHAVTLYDQYLEYLVGGNLDIEICRYQQADVLHGGEIDHRPLLFVLFSSYCNVATL